MSLALIWAEAHDGVIGADGTMPWHVPEDLAHFRQLTGSSPVIMGRRTWESLPERFRPLPGRANIVVTRRPDWSAEGAVAAHSVDEALTASAISVDATAWVIGGAHLYRAAIDLADRLEVTEIDADIAGDTVAPKIDASWTVVATDPVDGWHSSSSGLAYRFVRYERTDG